MTPIQPGVLLEGTLLASDLIASFWPEFKRHYEEGICLAKEGEWESIFSAMQDLPDGEFKESVDYGALKEDAGHLIESLIEDLDGACYEQNMTFGPHPDDPACWGFWEWAEEDYNGTA